MLDLDLLKQPFHLEFMFNDRNYTMKRNKSWRQDRLQLEMS